MAEPVRHPRLSTDVLDRSIAYKLRLAQIVAWRAFEGRVSGYGTAPRYLGLITLIGANPGQPQSRLAEAVALQRSSLVAILDRLEAEGIVERRGDEKDRRLKTVWLTPSGQKQLEELSVIAARHEEQLGRGLDAEERERIIAALDRLIENLRES